MTKYLKRGVRLFRRQWTMSLVAAFAVFLLAPSLVGCATAPALETGARSYPTIVMFVGSG
ncbi:hypothetical protein [Geomonas ferrireducens]|uniref:hypothetical protein n=1 Tax=Geomonas ferrireducens TaxID=2570227 RepID=UPI0038B4107E